MGKKRLFIVSNRLPLTVVTHDDQYEVKPASGGLVSAIRGYLSGATDKIPFDEIIWCGIPGCKKKIWQQIESVKDPTYRYLPVFVSEQQYDRYYNGLANSTLWPLFHYFPSFSLYDEQDWIAYEKTNEAFADTLKDQLQEDDIVWIQDYHLFLLPQLLRKLFPSLTIGFFLHIPFPSYEMIRLLPKHWQVNILEGLLGADLIGLHTIDYASHLLYSFQVVLQKEHEQHIIQQGLRFTKVDIFPISIHYEAFNKVYNDPAVKSGREKLKAKFRQQHIIFSIDRLDYTKGISNRLMAYERFLQKYPEYQGKVVFILIVIPSRDTIQKYSERKKMIDELISSINSSLGTIDWQPIIYRYRSLKFEELLTLYTVGDIALITPIRDGMNLVAKEFVASRADQKGVLILSEMAGAARELTDALIINPNDVEDLCTKIYEGLNMPIEEQQMRIQHMQERIMQYDINAWAEDFLYQLHHSVMLRKDIAIKVFNQDAMQQLIKRYKSAKKCIFFLDDDGTMIEFNAHPENAIPSFELKSLVSTLSSHPKNEVFLITGRGKSFLEKWWQDVPVHFVAENGMLVKLAGHSWTGTRDVDSKWKAPIRAIMQNYSRRCAGAFIEEKSFSIVWHFRNSNIEHGKLRAAEMYKELLERLSPDELKICLGNKTVEVKLKNADKGKTVKRLIKNHAADLIIIIGDDKNDETMFKFMKDEPNVVTLKVGMNNTYAHYNIPTPDGVRTMLKLLNDTSQ